MDAAKGSIRQRGSGSYELRLYVGTDPCTGRRRRWLTRQGGQSSPSSALAMLTVSGACQGGQHRGRINCEVGGHDLPVLQRPDMHLGDIEGIAIGPNRTLGPATLDHLTLGFEQLLHDDGRIGYPN